MPFGQGKLYVLGPQVGEGIFGVPAQGVGVVGVEQGGEDEVIDDGVADDGDDLAVGDALTQFGPEIGRRGIGLFLLTALT